MSIEILENVDLKSFNTFNVSAFAKYFINATQIDHLQNALKFCKKNSLPYILLGQGSNILFKNNYPGLVIEINIKGYRLIKETENSYFVNAMCGQNWDEFVQYCLQNYYFGIENLSLIPGSIGAAPVNNIGAYGAQVSDLIHGLRAIEIKTGDIVKFTNKQCEFTYRSSVFKNKLQDQYIISEVTFKFKKNAKINITNLSLSKALSHIPEATITPMLVRETVCNLRNKLYYHAPSMGNAGSFFWNPIIDNDRYITLKKSFPDILAFQDKSGVKLSAEWLIEQAGWKGYRNRNVGVHQNKPGVLVNFGEATGEELFELANNIQGSVREMFGITLIPEVKII
jgi:UDP-N-acetylmuramate dehydrogenase